MIHAIPQLLTIDYIPKDDRDSEQPTKFKLQPLSGTQFMEVLCEIDAEGHYTAKGLLLALKYGLCGWDNFCESNGGAIPFAPVNFGKIPPMIVHEVALEIINRSSLGEKERKN